MTDIEKKVIENYIEDNQYIEQIDKYYNKSLDRHKPIFIGKTSNALSISGAKQDLDIMINPSTLDKCVGKPTEISHGHELDKSIIEQLPQQLRNPIMILKNEEKNSLVAITNLKDKNNNNIIIAISLNNKYKWNEINRIASIYGKEHINNYLSTQIKKGNLISYNNKKANKMLHSIGLQLPKENTLISYDNSISYTTENVKYPTKERSEIMEEKIKENLDFTEVISHDEFIQSKPVKDVKQLENKELNKKSIALDEKAPAKYTAQHIKETYSQEFDKSKDYSIPQESIVNIENELDSSKENILDVLKQMADNKDLHAKNMLALAYYFGDSGATKDIDKAIELFVEAAGEGYAVAQRNLAIICENSEPKDMEKAIEYYQMAINNETPDAYALNNLGVCYLTGEGVKSNPKKAVELFIKAAELGDDYAKLNLADAYYLGNGTRQSFKKAFELYKDVAEKGNVTALKYLAECYQEGKGTEVNYKLALECYQKAAEKGDEDAKYKYTELNNKINPHKHVEVDNAVKQSLEDNIKVKQDTIKEAYEQKKLDNTEQEKNPDISDNPDNKQEQAPEKAQQAKPEKARNDGPEL